MFRLVELPFHVLSYFNQTWSWRNFFKGYLLIKKFIYLLLEKERERRGRSREKGTRRLCAKCGVLRGAWPHDPEVMAWTEIKRMFKGLIHPGAPKDIFLKTAFHSSCWVYIICKFTGNRTNKCGRRGTTCFRTTWMFVKSAHSWPQITWIKINRDGIWGFAFLAGMW